MSFMKVPFGVLITSLSLASVGTWLVMPTGAQQATSGDWPSHNLDLANSRYSPLDQITTSNASQLKQQWSVQTTGKDVIRQVTPLVVDGVMYYDAGSKPEDPRWKMVDVGFVEKLPRTISLDELKAEPALEGMVVLQKGTRLSVTPVSKAHFEHVRAMARR